jgi:Flp pilus assembly protein TadD
MSEPRDQTEAYDAFVRGSALLAQRDYHQAAVALERARRLEPDKGSVREALGRAYLSCRRYEAARLEFQAAVDLHPTDGYAHFGLARSLDRLGLTRLAARHYRLARCFGQELE